MSDHCHSMLYPPVGESDNKSCPQPPERDWKSEKEGPVYGVDSGASLECPIFCAVGRVSVTQLFLSSSSRRRGCGEVGSA